MTPEEEVWRAEKAQQILNEPVVRQALDEIKQSLIQQWSKAPVKDVDLKEKLWGIYNAAEKFEELLKVHIESGKMAAVQMQPGWKQRLGF